MIPYHFHFIWMGKHFPYLNRLAVESVLQTNPEAEITLHYLDPPDNENWQALQGRIQFKEIDLLELSEGFEEKEGLLKSLAGVASSYPAGRSNLYRYLILHRWGGIYLDFDTLTLQSLKPLLKHKAILGEERVFKSNEARVQGKRPVEMLWTAPAFGLSWLLTRLNCHYLGNLAALNFLENLLLPFWSTFKLNNAVLACEPGHAFFKRAIQWIPHRDPAIRFNLGPMLMNDIWNEGKYLEGAVRLPAPAFYEVPPSKTIRFFSPQQKIDFSSSYVVHYCSSNEKARAALLTQENCAREPHSKSSLIHELAWPFIKKINH